jgi:hypothetical protein
MLLWLAGSTSSKEGNKKEKNNKSQRQEKSFKSTLKNWRALIRARRLAEDHSIFFPGATYVTLLVTS